MHRHIAGAASLPIDDAAHAPNIDQPATFNSAVREFLGQL